MSEWKEYKLGEICDVRDGTHDSPKESKDGKPLVTSKNIKNGKLDLSNTYLISYEDYNQINKRSRVDKWDILFSMIGTIGESTIVNFDPNFAIKNVALFKTSDEHIAKWIYYYLKSSYAKAEINANIKGSTQQYISLADLRNFPILVPSLELQKQIVGILSLLDDKIDLLNRQNQTLESMAEGLFRHYFIDNAQSDWEEKSLFDCIELIGGGTPKTTIDEYWNGSIKWLSGGDIANNHKGFIFDAEKSISEIGLSNSSTKILPKYATVISARGTVGKFCILSEPMAFSQSNYGILPQYKDCFFFTYLLVSYYVDELQSAAYGSVFDTITTNTFKGLSVSLPSKELVLQFETMITAYFSKIYNNQSQINTLCSLRDTLLPKLMNKEIEVEGNQLK